jgi:hypothetical protein
MLSADQVEGLAVAAERAAFAREVDEGRGQAKARARAYGTMFATLAEVEIEIMAEAIAVAVVARLAAKREAGE